ncbi:hypothetical protein ACOSQ2_005258 [Xanthoceras sorbifolium]
MHGLVYQAVGEQVVRHGSVSVSHVWSAPINEAFKINTDAACFPSSNRTGFGVIIRDSCGHVMLSSTHNCSAGYLPFIAEALAIRKGLQLALEAGIYPYYLESDAATMVKLISSNVCLASDVSLLIKDILNLAIVARRFVFLSFLD